MVCLENGRTGGIRTHDLYHPKVARYQAAPQPDDSSSIALCEEDFNEKLRRNRVVATQGLYCGRLAIRDTGIDETVEQVGDQVSSDREHSDHHYGT